MYVCLNHSARRESRLTLETTQGWLEGTIGSVAPGPDKRWHYDCVVLEQ